MYIPHPPPFQIPRNKTGAWREGNEEYIIIAVYNIGWTIVQWILSDIG